MEIENKIYSVAVVMKIGATCRDDLHRTLGQILDHTSIAKFEIASEYLSTPHGLAPIEEE